MSVQQEIAISDPKAMPRVFGRYLLVERLSRGGMGELFLARHGLSGFEKPIVIKKILPNLAADPDFLTRFVDEAQVAVKLQHANIAQVFEVGRVEDEYFLSIEYVEGRDLRHISAMLEKSGRRIPVDLALYIAREAANGLAYAHRRTAASGESLAVVHCDISPPNILVSFEGEVKVIDFGIAKSTMRLSQTDPNRGFGKFGYMAPEQLVKGGVVDHRTDVYSLGVVLYELLTGARLFEVGDNPDYRALAKMVVGGVHAKPSDIDPLLQEYDDLVLRALATSADKRYATAAAFRDELQSALLAVNPTISSDRLAGFMGNLYRGEKRVRTGELAAADLQVLQEELRQNAAQTVSLAKSDLVTLSAIEHVGEADPKKLVVTERRFMVRPRFVLLIALVAAALTGTLTLWLMSAGDTDDVVIVDEPIAQAPVIRELQKAGDGVKAAVAQPEPAAQVPSKPQRNVTPAPAALPKKKDDKKEAVNVEPTVSAEKVHAAFQAAHREYQTFRESYGTRLETEWNDLTNFAAFAQSPDKLLALEKRVAKFRSSMAEARKAGGI